MKRNVRNIGIAGALLAAMGLPATATAAEHDGQWHVTGELYLWGADTKLKSAAGQGVEVDFDDVVSNLEMAFMASLGARKDRWSWFGDVMYVGIDASETVPAKIPEIPTPLNATVKLEQDAWIVTLGGGYEISSTPDSHFDVTAGLRYFSLETDVSADLGGGLSGSVHDESDVLDAVVGLKGRARLGDKWYLNYYADIGTGESDLTWQALAGVNYTLSKVDVGVGYRILQWQLDGSGYLDEFEISGPYALLAIKFK